MLTGLTKKIFFLTLFFQPKDFCFKIQTFWAQFLHIKVDISSASDFLMTLKRFLTVPFSANNFLNKLQTRNLKPI